MKTVVLGIGNLLLADEGVGVHAARALSRERLPDGTVVIDVGMAVLDVLPALAEAECLIVVDAVRAGAAPGTVYRMALDDFARKDCIASMHGFDIVRAMALAGRASPPDVVVVGVEPEVIGWSLDLSPAVERALPLLLRVVKEEIRSGATAAHPGERGRRIRGAFHRALPARPRRPRGRTGGGKRHTC